MTKKAQATKPAFSNVRYKKKNLLLIVTAKNVQSSMFEVALLHLFCPLPTVYCQLSTDHCSFSPVFFTSFFLFNFTSCTCFFPGSSIPCSSRNAFPSDVLEGCFLR